MALDGKSCVIRHNDYYGGDVTVVITWESWGKYGGVDIVITPEEAEKLRNALTRMLDPG
jgi:hypothetical protein